MWESNIFESSEEELPSKKRDTRNKSPAKSGCSRQQKMLKKAEKQSIVSKIKSLTPENIATVSDVASCNRCIVGGTIRFDVESVMVARDKTNLDIGATSSHEYKISISNSCNRLFHFDFSVINTFYSHSPLMKVLIFNNNNR